MTKAQIMEKMMEYKENDLSEDDMEKAFKKAQAEMKQALIEKMNDSGKKEESIEKSFKPKTYQNPNNPENDPVDALFNMLEGMEENIIKSQDAHTEASNQKFKALAEIIFHQRQVINSLQDDINKLGNQPIAKGYVPKISPMDESAFSKAGNPKVLSLYGSQESRDKALEIVKSLYEDKEEGFSKAADIEISGISSLTDFEKERILKEKNCIITN